MNSCTRVKVENKTIFDFLYDDVPAYTTWTIYDSHWRVGLIYIDDEDLWAGWFPKQHRDKMVASYSYDSETKTGTINYK